MLAQLVPLVAALMERKAEDAAPRVQRSLILYALATLVFLTLYGAALAAALIALTEAYGAVGALIAIAVAALIAELALIGVILTKRRDDRAAARRTAMSGDTVLTMAAMTLLPELLRSRWIGSAAAIGGVALLLARLGARRSDGAGSTDPV